MTWASALSDISVSFAESAAQSGRMMLPDARRKKFRAVEEDAKTGRFRPINPPAGPITVGRAALPATASACGSARQPGLVAGSAKHVLPELMDTQEMFR